MAGACGLEAGTRRWEWRHGPGEGRAQRARAQLARALRQAGVDSDVADDAMLVLSELAANAIRHARTDFTVRAAVADDRLRIEVFDHDGRPPALMGVDSDAASGRGLHIVAAVAADWGWQTAEGADGVPGKVVWAEILLDGHRPEPSDR